MVGNPICGGIQIGIQINPAGVDIHRWKLLAKFTDGLINGIPAKLVHKPGVSLIEHNRVDIPAIKRENIMQDFIHQPHGVDLAGFYSSFRCPGLLLKGIQFSGEDPGGVEIRKNYISGKRKETLIKITAIPHPT